MRKIRNSLILAGALVLAMLAGSAAHAVLTARTGTFSERQFFVAESTAWVTSSAAWTNVPGAVRSVTVPAGTNRLLDVRYTAESQCGGSSGWCSVRVVLVSPSGGVGELFPASGTDFAFDSPGDAWESHAIERSSWWLSPGTYRVLVQAAVVSGASFLRLDDWHMTTELVRP